MNSSTNFFVVIMAGGTGTRLWPLSRKARPKQFHSFHSAKTLLQETFERASSVVESDHIFVSTGSQYADLILEELPEITRERLIIEPEARNTGPAVSLVASTMAERFPEAIVATIASDHAIENPDEFTTTLSSAFETVSQNPDKLVTVGINPTAPDTGLGYIKLGQEYATIKNRRVFVVDSFKEKPDQKTAEEYLRSFDYLWNAGYFIFSVQSFLSWIDRLAPELAETLKTIRQERSAGSLTPLRFAELYHQTPLLAIDYLLVEKLGATDRLVIPSPLQWSDVGNWNALHGFLKKDERSFVVLGKHLDHGSHNLLVHGGKRLITTLNVKDLVIVDTDDALLVADRESVGTDIRALLESIKKEFPESL